MISKSLPKVYKCYKCDYETKDYNTIKQHYVSTHKNQYKKNKLTNLEKNAKKRLKATGCKAYAYQLIRKLGTTHENKIKDILNKNKSYFEFQPIVFSKELQISISPDFIVYSWNSKRLKQPFYLEIDGDNKDLSIEYQKKRYESLSQKYPVLRIYNKEVDEKLVKNVIKNFIFKNVLLAIR